MEGRVRVCELCSGLPDLYCSSDDAYLCFDCDSRVHATNFLVARHLRLIICRHCRSLTGNSFSGPGSHSQSPASCTSCTSSAPEETDSISCSSSISAPQSLCSGSSSSIHRHRPDEEVVDFPRSSINDGKVRVVLSNWCRKVGVKGDLVEAKAVEAMEMCWGRGRLGRVLPFRLSLAASFWLGARLSGDGSPRNLLKLAQVSGIPAELIVRVESKLEGRLRSCGRSRRREPEVVEEGWGESGV
ncbi:B-box zinc finger protein 32 [Linum grandiflorum]